MRRVRFGAGERIITQGESGDSLYVIRDGDPRLLPPAVATQRLPSISAYIAISGRPATTPPRPLANVRIVSLPLWAVNAS